MTQEYISYTEYCYLMNRIAYWLVKNGKKFNTRSVYGYFDRVSDYGTIIKTIQERGTNYETDALISEFVECAIVDNKDLSFLPNSVTGSDGTKYYTNTFVSMANRVSAYEVLNGKSPNIVNVTDTNTTSNTTDSTLQKCKNAFGSFSTIDEFLTLIQGRGYSYYYNSRYNTDTTISRIKNRKGVNCTDSAQLTYRVAVALGYSAQFIHVKCKSGGGHIRLRLKHSTNTGGEWIYRDPASVLKGNNIKNNWCTNGTIIAYNPSWIFSDLYQ